MKINDKRIGDYLDLEFICVGECFITRNEVYIKIEENNNETSTAKCYNLNTNEIHRFDFSLKVKKVNVELNIID